MAERWLAIASMALLAACGPRQLTVKDVQAMTDDEKQIACQEAWELRSKPQDTCNEIKTFDNRRLCVSETQRLRNIGLMNFVILDCTRVGLRE